MNRMRDLSLLVVVGGALVTRVDVVETCSTRRERLIRETKDKKRMGRGDQDSRQRRRRRRTRRRVLRLRMYSSLPGRRQSDRSRVCGKDNEGRGTGKRKERKRAVGTSEIPSQGNLDRSASLLEEKIIIIIKKKSDPTMTRAAEEIG